MRLLVSNLLVASFLAATAAIAQEPGPSAPPTVDRLLDERVVSVDFLDAELPHALAEFGKQTGVPWLIDAAQIPTPKDLRVSLQVKDLRARRFLDLLAAEHALGYRIGADGILVVTTQESVQRDAVLEVFDFQHDENVGPWFGGDLGFRRRRESDEEGRDPWALDEAVTAGLNAEELQNLIKENIAKGTWDTYPNNLIYYNGLLIVRHTPEVVKQIGDVLRGIREHRPRPMAMEWGIVEVPESALPAQPPGSPETARIVATEADRKAWWDALGRSQAAWRVRRVFPVHADRSPDQGAARHREAADRVDEEGVWAYLLPEVLQYRRDGADRLMLKASLDARLRSGGAEISHRAESVFDVAGGDLVFLPLAREANGIVRALALSLTLPPGLPPREEPEPPAPEDPSLAPLRELARQKITLDLAPAPLARHVSVLRARLGCNLHIGPHARIEGKTDQRIGLTLKDVTVATVLTVLTRQYGLSWRITPGVILIDSEEFLEPVLPVQMLDFRDLSDAPGLGRPPDLARAATGSTEEKRGAYLQLSDGERRARRSVWYVEEERAAITAEALQDMVKGNVAPVTWEERSDEVGIAMDATGVLWVIHTAPVVAEIRAFLGQIRAAMRRQYRIEYRLVAVPRAEAAGGLLTAEAGDAWWTRAAGPDLWHAGGMIARGGGAGYSATVARFAPGPEGTNSQRGLVVAVTFGGASKEGSLPVWLRIDWAQAALVHPLSGPARGIDYDVAGFDGSLELPPGRTQLIVLGELPDGRSLVAGVRCAECR